MSQFAVGVLRLSEVHRLSPCSPNGEDGSIDGSVKRARSTIHDYLDKTRISVARTMLHCRCWRIPNTCVNVVRAVALAALGDWTDSEEPNLAGNNQQARRSGDGATDRAQLRRVAWIPSGHGRRSKRVYHPSVMGYASSCNRVFYESSLAWSG